MARLRQQYPQNYGSSGNIHVDFENIVRYLNSAELGDKTLGELLAVLFNADGEFEGAGAGVHDAHGAPAAELRELCLEALHLRAARDPAGPEHFDDAGDGLFVEGGTGEGEEGGGHGFGFVAIGDRDCRRRAGCLTTAPPSRRRR